MTLRRILAAVAAVGSVFSVGAVATPAHATTYARWGCPGGAVCIYSRAAWASGGGPDVKVYAYGYNALYNQWGSKVILNNQYETSAGKAAAYACTSVGNCGTYIAQDVAEEVWMDPINYLLLTSSGG